MCLTGHHLDKRHPLPGVSQPWGDVDPGRAISPALVAVHDLMWYRILLATVRHLATQSKDVGKQREVGVWKGHSSGPVCPSCFQDPNGMPFCALSHQQRIHLFGVGGWVEFFSPVSLLIRPLSEGQYSRARCVPCSELVDLGSS